MQTQIVVTAGIGVRELSCNKTNLTASILILVYVIAIKDERTETKKNGSNRTVERFQPDCETNMNENGVYNEALTHNMYTRLRVINVGAQCFCFDAFIIRSEVSDPFQIGYIEHNSATSCAGAEDASARARVRFPKS